MGADAVIYQDVDGLKQSITDAQCGPKTMMNPCTACLDGKYPTDVAASAKGFAAARKMDRDGKAS
jgi:glutamine phosphoribosylpyrophosphate amidotransferase